MTLDLQRVGLRAGFSLPGGELPRDSGILRLEYARFPGFMQWNQNYDQHPKRVEGA